MTLSSPVPQGRETRFAHLCLDRRLTDVPKKLLAQRRRDLPSLSPVDLRLEFAPLGVREV
jgi:hypothetical protein